MKVYKLTTQQQTTGTMVWKRSEWYARTGVGELCSGAFLHAYPSALCAMFMNPVHARIPLPRLWVGEGMGTMLEDCGLKIGCAQMRIMDELIPPIIDQEHRIRLALLASLQVCGNTAWREYARNYIDGPVIKYRPDTKFIESEEERAVRTYAYKAAMYENVEYNAAIAVQTAAQFRPFDTAALFRVAWGGEYVDEVAAGRSREGPAL